MSKRFTEAELVATLWFTRWVRSTVRRFNKTHHFSELDNERVAVLRRFASLPHYDDPDYHEEEPPKQEVETSERFREAELAADLWFMLWVRSSAFRFSTVGGPSELDNERLAALRRFATLPHYDDSDSYKEEEFANWAEGMSRYNPTPDELDAILQYEYGSYGVELPEWYLNRFNQPDPEEVSVTTEEAAKKEANLRDRVRAILLEEADLHGVTDTELIESGVTEMVNTIKRISN